MAKKAKFIQADHPMNNFKFWSYGFTIFRHTIQVRKRDKERTREDVGVNTLAGFTETVRSYIARPKHRLYKL